MIMYRLHARRQVCLAYLRHAKLKRTLCTVKSHKQSNSPRTSNHPPAITAFSADFRRTRMDRAAARASPQGHIYSSPGTPVFFGYSCSVNTSLSLHSKYSPSIQSNVMTMAVTRGLSAREAASRMASKVWNSCK
jgi:hypothetical protein